MGAFLAASAAVLNASVTTASAPNSGHGGTAQSKLAATANRNRWPSSASHNPCDATARPSPAARPGGLVARNEGPRCSRRPSPATTPRRRAATTTTRRRPPLRTTTPAAPATKSGCRRARAAAGDALALSMNSAAFRIASSSASPHSPAAATPAVGEVTQEHQPEQQHDARSGRRLERRTAPPRKLRNAEIQQREGGIGDQRRRAAWPASGSAPTTPPSVASAKNAAMKYSRPVGSANDRHTMSDHQREERREQTPPEIRRAARGSPAAETPPSSSGDARTACSPRPSKGSPNRAAIAGAAR